MTDNEIVKALECCKKAIWHQDCLDLKCPYVMEFGCNIDKEDLRNMALDLINRLKANEEKNENVIRLADKTIEKQSKEMEEQQAEIERLSTEIDQRHEMMANLGVELDKAQSLNKALGNDVDIKLKYIYDLEERLNKYQHIESSISEFWTGLEKLSMYKGKEKPTLEELLEYIEQVKDEAVIEFAKTLNDTSEDCTGKGYPYVLCKDIDRIADDWTGGAFKKVKHSSLCETETYEG